MSYILALGHIYSNSTGIWTIPQISYIGKKYVCINMSDIKLSMYIWWINEIPCNYRTCGKYFTCPIVENVTFIGGNCLSPTTPSKILLNMILMLSSYAWLKMSKFTNIMKATINTMQCIKDYKYKVHLLYVRSERQSRYKLPTRQIIVKPYSYICQAFLLKLRVIPLCCW